MATGHEPDGVAEISLLVRGFANFPNLLGSSCPCEATDRSIGMWAVVFRPHGRDLLTMEQDTVLPENRLWSIAEVSYFWAC
jgi:hypothetical protein